MKLPRFITGIFFAMLVVACGVQAPDPKPGEAVLVGPDSWVVYNIEIADTDTKRTMGLMHVEFMPEDAGMLFVFPDEAVRKFWMMNTKIPLDILYFDEDGDYVSSASMDPCKQHNCPLYPSEKPAMYALELNQGQIEKHGIAKQWKLRWNTTK